MSLFSSTTALALHNSNPKPQHTFFGSVDYRYNTVVCGGRTGSVSENRAHRIILNKFAYNYREGYPTILLTSSLPFAEEMYRHYNDDIIVYGVNKSYDPFASFENYDDASFILNEAAAAFSDNPKLTVWCNMLITIMEMYGFEITFNNLRIIAGKLFSANGINDFCEWISNVTGEYVPDALKQSLNREWTSLSWIQNFMNRLNRQFGYVRHGGNELESDFIVMYLPQTDSEIVGASLFGEMRLLCRNGRMPPFTVLNVNIPFGKAAEELFLYNAENVTFGMYVSSLRMLGKTFSAISPSIENLVCMGVDAADANTIIELYSSQSNQWQLSCGGHGIGAGMTMTPQIVPQQLMTGRRGIPEGGAMIYTASSGNFHNVKILT